MNLERPTKKTRQRESTTTTTTTASLNIPALDHDILSIIFSFLDLFDLVRCCIVCKSWNFVIKRSKFLHALYCKQHDADADAASSLSIDLETPTPLNILLEDMAMRRHKSALVGGKVHVDQLRGHETVIDQCRMKRGLILTGAGDKVMRLWSSESYKLLREYSLFGKAPLVDFDFDESKVVGLVGTRICIWRQSGDRSVFPAREGTFTKGLCMRYMDPEAVVGCEDGTVRVFDMYSRSCSRIIRMHPCSVSCIALGDEQLILSGSSYGSVTISGLSSDQTVATLRSTDRTGIKTLCYNPSSQLVFAGSTSGYATCWDLRKMRSLWETRVSPNVLYSMQHLRGDKSVLVAGGIDGVVRVVDQNNGEVLTGYAMKHEGNGALTSARNLYGRVERKKVKRITQDPHTVSFGGIPPKSRPPIKCLAVGMKKVVTIHNDKYIRMWRFDN